MDENPGENTNVFQERFLNILKSLSQCKIDFINEKEETKKIRDAHLKLEVELKEARESEKSNRYHLLTSREMIANLQDTVSQLVYLKRDVKKMKDEIAYKDSAINTMEKEKESILQKHGENVSEMNFSHEKQIQELNTLHERQVQQIQQDSDTQLAQLSCVIEELRAKLQETEANHRDKMNVVVLEYEEKIQRGAAQVSQLQEQLARQAARTDANIDAYRRRLEELEEKLKQTQLKQYLAQSYPSQYESQVERPYSVERDYTDSSIYMNSVMDTPKPQKQQPLLTQNKAPKPSNTLQVMYYDNKAPNVPKNEKKGQFSITKKRKLYSEKDTQDF